MKVAIGVDLGGTKLLGALVSEAGKILARREEPTDGARGADAVTGSIASLVRALADEARRSGHSVTGVGVGAPGPVHPETGTIWAMANLGPSWRLFPLREKLGALLPGLAVHVENDANAATAGEAWCGGASGKRDVVMLTLGTGVGGGIVTGGVLVRGSRGVGAELGHVCVFPDGHRCGCGGHGCLEQYCSGPGAARLAAEAVAKARAAGTLAGPLATGEPTTAAVLAAARAGDPLAREIVASIGRILGLGLVTLVHTLNPEVVLIGGGFGSAAFDLLAPIARRELDGRSFEASREGLTIERATLGPDAGVVGAARSALG